MYRRLSLSLILLLSAVGFASAQPTPAATYFFNNSLASEQGGGVPALTATDPLGANVFLTQTVFGQDRTVYAFNGTASPATLQAGLTLDTTGLVTPTNYSAELVFQFSQNNNAWRRIIDVQNRTSDNGFYVDPSNNLDIFPVAGSSSLFTNDAYHHVVLTVAGGTTAKAYLDGVLQFTSSTALMNINNVDNPGNLLNLFLDNTAAGGQGEFSSGDIALFRMYDAVLTDDEVAALASNPFAAVPEPSTLVLGSAAFLGLVGYQRFNRKKRRTIKKK